MRTPSDKLTELLTRLQLCDPAELAACEKRVRRLCHDLPDFDSVWLDALVQQRILTPWQTDLLLSSSPQRLNVGRYVLRQPLGPCSTLGHDVSRRHLYVFRQIGENQQSTDERSASMELSAPRQLRELVDNLAQSASRCPNSLLLPFEVITGDNPQSAESLTAIENSAVATSFVISPFVPGWSLSELLIRGGRFPWPAVAEIGRELLTALSWLEGSRVLHGDVVLKNVRLTPHGRVILIDPFVRRHLQPRVLLTEALTLRDCDGIAPEMVGTGRIADVRSELYALGCLLWQLLACRSVVLTTDPVSRLMKLREQDVADVRGLVPDCPEWMARLILSMTRRSPELRPSSVDEVLKQWRANTGNGYRQSQAIVRQLPQSSFSDRPPRLPVNGRRKNARQTVRVVSTTAVLLLLLMFVGTRIGILPQTLRMGSPSIWLTQLQHRTSTEPTGIIDNDTLAEQLLYQSAAVDVSDGASSGGILELPELNVHGQMLLYPGRIYRAVNITHSGPLAILSTASAAAGETTEKAADAGNSEKTPDGSSMDSSSSRSQPVIRIMAGTEWRLEASEIRLNDLRIELAAFESDDSAERGARSLRADRSENVPDNSTARAMLHLISSDVSIDHCVLENGDTFGAGSCCYWTKSADDSSSIVLKDTIVSSRGYGIRMEHPAERISLDNTLLATRGSAIRCDFSAPDDQQLHVELNHVSQRGGPALIDAVIRDTAVPEVVASIRGGESVLVPAQALMRVAAPEDWAMDRFRAEFLLPQTGNATIVPPGIEWALFFDVQLKTFVRLSDQQVTAESLLIAEPVFGAPDDTSSSSSAADTSDPGKVRPFELMDFEGPKLNSQMPGIEASRLPRW